MNEMTIYDEVRATVAQQPPGTILALSDFTVPSEKWGALAKSLSRLNQQGTLRRLVKGLYFKPGQGILGEIQTPSFDQLLKKLLDQYKDKVSYITGIQAYSAMSLTTQIAREFVIATDKPRSPVKVGMTEVRFTRSYVTEPIPEEDIALVQLLDAICDIKNIPATTPAKAARVLRGQLRQLSITQRQRLMEYALQYYPPQTRALTGMLLESIGEGSLAQALKGSLNPLTTFRLSLDAETFPTIRSWNIV